MHCLRIAEARALAVNWLGDDREIRRADDEMQSERVHLGAESYQRVYELAMRLVEVLGPWEEAWLWLREVDTWNRQGLHLYTRVRESYGERSLITEKPVQQFYGFESADLCTFVSVALLNEWSFFVGTSHDYGRVFVSRSAGAELWFRDGATLNGLRRLTGPVQQG